MDANSTDPSDAGSSNSTLLPGQSPPLSVITATDQGGVVIIATALGLVFSLVSLLIRLFIRFEFSSRFSRDDVASFLSMLFSIVQSSIVFAAVAHGFGKAEDDIPAADVPVWQEDVYVSDIFYIITMWLTKCSVAFLFLRLSPDRSHNVASHVLLALCTVFMVASVLAVSVRCDMRQPWIIVDGQCTGLFARWEAVTVLDILTEVGLFAIALFMIQGLQLPLRKKLVVTLAFGLRLPVIVAAILRLDYLGAEFASTDPSLGGVLAAVCTQVQISYAIVATTTPCLRPFMSALSTHYGGGGAAIATPPGTKTGGSRATIRTGTVISTKSAGRAGTNNAFAMSSLTSSSGNGRGKSACTITTTTTTSSSTAKLDEAERGGRLREQEMDRSAPQVRWDNTEYNVAINAAAKGLTTSGRGGSAGGPGFISPGGGGGSDQHSMDSNDSQRMIISKNTEWTVDYEDQSQPARPYHGHQGSTGGGASAAESRGSSRAYVHHMI